MGSRLSGVCTRRDTWPRKLLATSSCRFLQARRIRARRSVRRSVCRAFNAQTQSLEKGLPTPVVITVYSDRSFSFILKTPPASVLIRKAIGIEKGSGTPNTNKVGKINRKQLEAIAKVKQPDLTAADLDAAIRTIAGSARSMGVDVEGL